MKYGARMLVVEKMWGGKEVAWSKILSVGGGVKMLWKFSEFLPGLCEKSWP
jgi:hypothetical protein